MGRYHMCAQLTTGFVECWGYNGYGQLGTGDTTNRLTPTEVLGLQGELDVRRVPSCELQTWSWHLPAPYPRASSWNMSFLPISVYDLNNAKELDGLAFFLFIWSDPSFFLAGNVVLVAPGRYHTCALLINGTINCWGNNDYGELGNGDTTNRLIPTAVLGLVSGWNIECVGVCYDSLSKCNRVAHPALAPFLRNGKAI